MTDSGGSAGGDEGPIIKGLQWVLQNVNTDWGNNDSSEGIDVMTMSFGSGSSPVGEMIKEMMGIILQLDLLIIALKQELYPLPQ